MKIADTVVELIEKSGLFDKEWYQSEYQDVNYTGLDPVQHYLKYGAHFQRNPGLKFNTRYYLESNNDVTDAGINPLVHYAIYGVKEGRAPLPFSVLPIDCAERVDIVVPVFNALEDVKKCLKSIKMRQDGFTVRTIVVNDGSDSETTDWLKSFCVGDETFHLIEHFGNMGYTKAVNSGLRSSTAPYVVAINSDTIVTRGWIKGLVRCINSDPKIGIVGPLSNAASWQSVPCLYDSSGTFAINDLPNGRMPDDMAQVVAAASSGTYPRMPFINGFCFMIKRDVIDAIGIMDEVNFPIGYGEENDYCIRAGDAGFELAIADDTYVFHAKSKSFGHDRRKMLSKQGSDMLKRKHTEYKFGALVAQVKHTQSLDKVRVAIKQKIKETDSNAAFIDVMSIKILFLLPVKGGGGGAHSVVQEVSEMRRLGMMVKIAVNNNDLPSFLRMYQDISGARDLFAGFTPYNLLTVSEDYDVVVGTIFNSMALVKKIVGVYPHILPAYYVQDYEPMFFPPESENWQIARKSYTLVPNTILFAKTHWIANMVKQKHGVTVHKVSPSIDHAVYRPVPKAKDGKVVVAGMIRPQTPRRGAERTMRVLARVAQAHLGTITFHLFGCPEDDPLFQNLQQDFDFHNHGILKRPEVASLLAKSDIFIDLSDYQAFGRTALEAMACGCAAVVPVHGGADEYATDHVNTVVVDSLNEEECYVRLNALINDQNKLWKIQSAGMFTASMFSVHNAAMSEINLFGRVLPDHRRCYPIKERPKIMLMPSRRKNGDPREIGYVRVLLPYSAETVRRQWRVSVCAPAELPKPGTADVIIVQREAGNFSLNQIKHWVGAWRESGGKLIYDIDDDFMVGEGLRQPNFEGNIINRQLAEKVQWLAKEADVLTVSAPPLLKKFQKLYSNVHLIPDFLDADLWRIGKPRLTGSRVFKKKEGDPIRIGYIGTQIQYQTLEIVAEAMRQIEKAYGNRIEIEVIGAYQTKPPLFGRRVGWPKKKDYLSFVDWLHRRIHWDIGIIPLADNEYNKSKSRLKFLECSALNLACVCSNARSFKNVCRTGSNALTAENSISAWIEAIETLINDSVLRNSLATAAYDDISLKYTLQANSKLYLASLDFVVCDKQPSRKLIP